MTRRGRAAFLGVSLILLVLVSLLPQVAVADPATPILTDTVPGGGYADPVQGENPHYGYSDTSNKCKVCHAVHGASLGGEALLRTRRAEACIYCHVGTNFSLKQPYGTDPALYLNDYENNHSAGHYGSAYRGCPSCHSVHGIEVWSNAAEGIGVEKILRANPGGDMLGNGSTGAVAAPAGNLSTFCRDCHDKTNRADGTGTCVTCHDNPTMQVTDDPNHDGVSHIMTDTLTNDGGPQIANATTESCRSCHKGGAVPYQAGNSFPHLTPGADFLSDSHTSVSPLDQVCLDCHQWDDGAGGKAGVGATY